MPALTQKPDVTVGPLDRDSDALRLNWFLYRSGRTRRTGTWSRRAPGGARRAAARRSRSGSHYLLSAFPASESNAGDQEQFAHAALAAVMQRAARQRDRRRGRPALSPLAKPLVEPLRITLDALDLEAITKLWTAATQPMRLSVGYEVSLVVVDARSSTSPVRRCATRRVAVAPTLGPRFVSVEPPRAAFTDELLVRADGLTAGAAFTLAREDGDPAGPAERLADDARRRAPAPPGRFA